MPTDNTIQFDRLTGADLHVGAIYLGGTEGNAADDPLAKLLPVGNQGGFRPHGSPKRKTVRLSVLYTSGAEKEWPDELDAGTGVFTYYGDNRKPGRDLLKTTRGGNILLRDTFDSARRGQEGRLSVPPFLLFEKAGLGRGVRFVGLLAPHDPTPSVEDGLTIVRHRTKGQEFENFRARFTVLETKVVRHAWLKELLSGAATTGAECPDEWREWVGQTPRGRASESDASSGKPWITTTFTVGDGGAPQIVNIDPIDGAAAAGWNHSARVDSSRYEGLGHSADGSRPAELLDALRRLTVHRKDGKSAFYQYVVLLWAISRSSAARLTAFSAASESLDSLLAPFALTDRRPDPALPWIALADSPWWEIDLPDADRRHGMRRRDVVRRFDPAAGLSVEAYDLITKDARFRQEAVTVIADIGRDHPALDGLLERLTLRSRSASTDILGAILSAAGSSVPCVTAIPLEVRTTERFEQQNPRLVVAERRESELQDRYVRFLEDQGHLVCRQKILLPGEAYPLLTDMFDSTTGELVEVKADSGRATIRLALGQILDYARFVPHDSKAVLVPHEPATDLVELLLRCGVAVVWEGVPGAFRRTDPL
ncbi:hypothetical protein JO861_19340 [Rhodococcus hoagii]|uniref:hypothetical protein n=1 Tax=Rhodococcus hoagii TaxID=43767 RepID=UPI001962A370|nr:hypothetical protein [Prescottella equi]MBM9838704.1 hypothetical protein [Prescottella equi]